MQLYICLVYTIVFTTIIYRNQLLFTYLILKNQFIFVIKNVFLYYVFCIALIVGWVKIFLFAIDRNNTIM